MAVHPAAEIALVDMALPDLPDLLAGLRPGIEVRLVGPGEDGASAVHAALADPAVAAVHVVAHGAPGRVMLGRNALDAEVAGTLGPAGGDLLLYGCEAGAGEKGLALVATLARRLGAGGVLASSRPVGGGSWGLDVVAGAPRTASAFGGSTAWPHLLAVIDGTPGNDNLSGTSSQDVIKGYGGDDTIAGGGNFSSGPEILDGGDGNDSITGGFGTDWLYGGTGNDTLLGSGGGDDFNGGDGQDTFFVSGTFDGFDGFTGGAGVDIIAALSADTAIGVRYFSGTSTVERIDSLGYSGVYIRAASDGGFLDFSNTTLRGITRIEGQGGADYITGSQGSDTIRSGGGDDNIRESAGFDDVDGEAQASTPRFSARASPGSTRWRRTRSTRCSGGC